MRIFDYLNVSNERNLWADSGFHVQRNIITEILKKRNDYHFFLTLPIDSGKCNFYNSDLLTILPYKYSSGSGHKYHFNVNEFWKIIDWGKKDYDFILNNEVILGTHFYNLLCYKSHWDIPIVNYIHWIQTSDVKSNDERFTTQQFDMYNSIFWSTNTYCNSNYGKSLAMKSAYEIYKSSIVEEIDKKLHPLNVGFNDQELLQHKTEEKFPKITLIFNHRVSQYTGYEDVLKQCKKIWDEGTRNFELRFTSPSVSMTRKDLSEYKDFLIIPDGPIPYNEYLNMLWKSDICFGMHNGENQWSISFMEALFCDNVPIVTEEELFFKEMLETDTEHKLYSLKDLRYVIENLQSEKTKLNYFKSKLEKYYWRYLVDDYIKMFEYNYTEHDKNCDKLQDPVKSKVMQDIYSLLAKKPIISKSEIRKGRAEITGSGMGLQTPYSKYRKALLKICDDVIEREESVYRLKEGTQLPITREEKKEETGYMMSSVDEWL